MAKVTQTSSRKSDHIRINLEEDVSSGLTTGLERFRFLHQALPELDLEDVDLSVKLFKRTLKAPLLISSMTGGTEQAGKINLTLAEAAQVTGIAMGLGSQRVALEKSRIVFNLSSTPCCSRCFTFCQYRCNPIELRIWCPGVFESR